MFKAVDSLGSFIFISTVGSSKKVQIPQSFYHNGCWQCFCYSYHAGYWLLKPRTKQEAEKYKVPDPTDKSSQRLHYYSWYVWLEIGGI